MQLLQVARDAVLKDAPRAAKAEGFAAATELAELPTSRRRTPSFRLPFTQSTFSPSYADEGAVYVVVSVVHRVSKTQQVEVSQSVVLDLRLVH